MKKTTMKLMAGAMVLASMGVGASAMAMDNDNILDADDALLQAMHAKADVIANQRVSYSEYEGVESGTPWMDGIPQTPYILHVDREYEGYMPDLDDLINAPSAN